MKTRILWTLILSVGSAALYFGIVRPEVPTDSKRIRDYLEQDPASHPPVELPPLVVSESRLPEIPLTPPSPAPNLRDVPAGDALKGDAPKGSVR